MIFKATLWKNNSSEKEKYILVCHDFHNYSNALNYAHIDYFEKHLGSFNNVSFLLQTSDSATVAESRKLNQYNPLLELKELCLKQNKPCQSFIYCTKRARSYYKCLSALQYTEKKQFEELSSQLKEAGLTMSSLAEEFHAFCTSIKHNLELCKQQNLLSASLIQKLEEKVYTTENQWKEELTRWQKHPGTLCDYMQEQQVLTADFLTQMLNFDGSLHAIQAFFQALLSSEKVTMIGAMSLVCLSIEHLLKEASFTCLQKKGTFFNPEREKILVPGDLQNPKQHLRYMIYAEELIKDDGSKLQPLEPQFFNCLQAPEQYLCRSWWQKVQSFLQK